MRGKRNGNSCALAMALLIVLLLLVGCGADPVAQSTKGFPPGTGFVRHEFVFDGQPRPLWVFVPKDYTPQQRWPAVVFLHGLFEAGRDGDKCLTGGLGPVIAKSPDTWPFITIFPQSDGTWRGKSRQQLVLAALDEVESKWSIDKNRVILAGLSYGAQGTWEIGLENGDRFAALVPVSSRRLTEPLERVILLPVWAFSFAMDPWSSSDSSKEMCQQVTDHGGEARMTVFDGIGHDCWARAVKESNLVDWMLTQRRSPAVAAPTDGTALTKVE